VGAPVIVAVWAIEVPVWQIVEARVTAEELAVAAARANSAGRIEADPGVEAVLLKALIVAEVPPEARANGVVLAVVAVAVDLVAVVEVAEDAGRTIKAWQDGILEKWNDGSSIFQHSSLS
jgi:hypothetical protein